MAGSPDRLTESQVEGRALAALAIGTLGFATAGEASFLLKQGVPLQSLLFNLYSVAYEQSEERTNLVIAGALAGMVLSFFPMKKIFQSALDRRSLPLG